MDLVVMLGRHVCIHSPYAEGGSESKASSVLASGSEDGSVRLWCLARGTLLRVLPQCSGEAVTCLAQGCNLIDILGTSFKHVPYHVWSF